MKYPYKNNPFRNPKLKYFFCLSFLFVFFILKAQCDFPPKKPSKIWPVNDYASIFDSQEKAFLNQKLIQYADSTSTQILILTVDKLCGQNINNAAAWIGENWKIGQKEQDNGCVILLSKNDKQVSIQGGYGFQIHVPASVSQDIINQKMIPWFKKDDYANGINAGIDEIIKHLSGEYQGVPNRESEVDPVEIIIILLFFIIIIYILFSKGNSGGRGNYRRGNRSRGRGSFFPDVIITNSGSSSWGGGSSGGGFGGFGGGGSFGGGGASGSW